MLNFLIFALLINTLPAVLFVVLRNRVAALPLPGLWWLSLGTVAVVLTLALAKHLL
jgi:hypothetical protein